MFYFKLSLPAHASEQGKVISLVSVYFPAMLGVLAFNVVVYLCPAIVQWPSVKDACISATKVWLEKKRLPLFYSAFTHTDEVHLYYNMVSFMLKAATLEQHFGSAYFLYMTSVLTALTGVLYVGIKVLLSVVLNNSYMDTCCVGFSGVIFALKSLLHICILQADHMSWIYLYLPVWRVGQSWC